MAAASPLAPPPPRSGLLAVPGDPGPALVGHTLRYLRDPEGWAAGRYARYGPVSWARAFGVTLVGALTPDGAEPLLVNRDKAFSQAGWEYFIGPFFHRGLMLLDFGEHRHHRRVMQQAFTQDRLRAFIGSLGEAIDAGLCRWEPSDRFLVYPALKQLTLDLATVVFMGGGLGRQADRINQAFIATVRAGTAFVRRPVPGSRWWRGLRGRRRLEAFFAEQLPAKRAGGDPDLFSALCHAQSEDGDRFNDDDVVNHMIFLMMAAHDTVTITMSTICYYLARDPQWQERLRDESRAVGKPALEFDDLKRLPSLDLVIKEALRLVAPVPALPRRTVADTELLGHYVPAGTMVNIIPYFIHHLEEVWPQPLRFDPERFADDRREDRVHPYAWMPFGGGAHKCIGMHFAYMEIKAVLHQLLLRYRWRVDPDYEMPVDLTALPVPADGLPVTLERIGHGRGATAHRSRQSSVS
jgi:cytochrome P450